MKQGKVALRQPNKIKKTSNEIEKNRLEWFSKSFKCRLLYKYYESSQIKLSCIIYLLFGWEYISGKVMSLSSNPSPYMNTYQRWRNLCHVRSIIIASSMITVSQPRLAWPLILDCDVYYEGYNGYSEPPNSSIYYFRFSEFSLIQTTSNKSLKYVLCVKIKCPVRQRTVFVGKYFSCFIG